MKEFITALKHLMTFKTYTTMPRILEIGYGVIAWFCVGLIIYAWC